MADLKKRVSELPSSTDIDGLVVLGTTAQNESVKVPLKQVLQATEPTALESVRQTANTAASAAAAAQQTANTAVGKADAAQSAVDNLAATKGQASGLASLDTEGKVPQSQLPDTPQYDDVLEFAGILDTATIRSEKSSAKSTDSNAQVFFVTQTQQFVIGVRTDVLYSALVQNDSGLLQAPAVGEAASRLTDAQVKQAIALSEFSTLYTFYNDWEDRDLFADSNLVPLSNKIFTCTSTNVIYYYKSSESALTAIGKDSSADIAAMQSDITKLQGDVTSLKSVRLFFNGNALLGRDSVIELASFAELTSGDAYTDIRKSGAVFSLLTSKGWKQYQYDGGTWTDTANWHEAGGSAIVGNCFNVTVSEPLEQGYYTLAQAINVAYRRGYTLVGIQITFSIAEGSWKTYQYIGANTTESNFKNEANWLDLAGMSAGDESVININSKCGEPTITDHYTLTSALAALQSHETTSGITYAKLGLIITYRNKVDGQFVWEVKQFVGEVIGDFYSHPELWRDIAGGGSSVETSDEPEEDGKDAFSTGGAYTHIPSDLRIDTSEEGIVKVALIGRNSDVIGDEHQFAVGTGSGDSGGTIVTIEANNTYTKAGGDVILSARISSVTKRSGQADIVNDIESVELYDRDTNQLLETYTNLQTYYNASTGYYDFNLASYFTQAASRRFRLIAYDNTDHSASRNVTVVAVDVTIRSEQTLAYSASTVLYVGGASSRSLPMYSFPNNASPQGIRCITEIYINGEWRTLAEAIVTDTSSHSVAINPTNCLGYALTHGSYALRIHGVDVASGVVGNYLHTSVMCVDVNDTTPIIVTRWLSDAATANVKQYETISLDFAAYNPTATSMNVEIVELKNNVETVKRTAAAQRGTTYTYTQRVTDYDSESTITIELFARNSSIVSQTATFEINDTLLRISAFTDMQEVDIDFASRSNDDADKTIESNGHVLTLNGCTWRTTGFVRDSFGTAQYNTEGDTGIMALRIAENVTGTLDYAPFNVAAIETNGMAIQFRIRTKHIANDDAVLMSCISGGKGFYVTGKKVVLTFDNEQTVAHTIDAALKEDAITDVAIVIEPSTGSRSTAPYSGIGIAKIYFDGELIGACYYDSGTLTRHATIITFDGSQADLYLYDIKAWETFYAFEQSFYNYLLMLTDTDTMIAEYTFNDVFASQSAEGVVGNRPQRTALYNEKMPYFVLCKNADTSNIDSNYPEYLETLDGDKKTTATLDVYAFFPDRPYQDFKAIAAVVSNQGTTSSWRPIKNIKMKFKKATLSLLRTREECVALGYDGALYDECARNAAKHKVQILDTSVPTNIITVKVDYSESGGANNGASTNLFNDLQRELGSNYRTPAQNAYIAKNNGTPPYTLNTSIDSIPVAFFRTDKYCADATSYLQGYFHAKGNWNQDKGDAAVFGFENVDGYNDGALNYGDFYELIAARNQSLADFYAQQDTSTWEFPIDEKDASKGNFNVVVLSEFCGAEHRVFRRADNNSAWQETTGTVTCTNGVWRITGDVVNWVENYELRTYSGLDWFQGVNSVDDMLKPGADGKPIWLTHFESRYPDDDALNAAYEDGRKVPYRLYEWLKWCQFCNQHLTEDAAHNSETIEIENEDGTTSIVEKYPGGTNAPTTITIDGVEVPGTQANRLLKFKRELHKVANVYSMICYHVFTDYIAAVDQRSKNMMVGFYLDTDLQCRMYLNHLYDGDTILGSDNDCGLTIPAELDPNNDPHGYYQGHDSVLFTQLANSDYLWLVDYTSDSDTSDVTKTTTVARIAAVMRSFRLNNNLRLFSPEGIEKYWIKDRLSKWPKLVSSFDGMRKYITRSTAQSNYFYALHGLSIQRLQEYVKTRFLYRDGFYQCGDILTKAAQFRAVGTNITVTIKAAKDGYFALSADGTIKDSVSLQAGQSYTLRSYETNTGSGTMLYIYGADRISELNIRNATPKSQGWNISEAILLQKLYIGGDNYTPATNNGDELSALNLGQLPFLTELDIRNTTITSVNAQYCPRLQSILASGANSRLRTLTLAETSPISTLTLPATMTSISFGNLPNLAYPNGGLTIDGLSNIASLTLFGCKNINTATLLTNIVAAGGLGNGSEVFVTDIDMTASVEILQTLMENGVKGIGTELDNTCDGLRGTWLLTELVEDNELSALQNYYPELTIHNAQFTGVMFNDTIADPMNMTNLDNGTSGEDYEPSGHILRIRAGLIPVFGKLNTTTGKFECVPVSEEDYKYLKGESEMFDYTDQGGSKKDVMMRAPRCWYKGVNDFKTQKKYIFWSSQHDEPLSTAHVVRRATLSTLTSYADTAVKTQAVTIGVSTIDSAGVLGSETTFSAYRYDNLAGMKQVRFPAVNSGENGAVFLNEQGIIIGIFNMDVSASDMQVGDYVFCDVPVGAVSIVFTAPTSSAADELIAVDSSEIEAIEPDWVLNEEWLCGVYEASIDGQTNLRSLSGVAVKVGNGTSRTNTNWSYDENGRPTNTPSTTINYTCKDFMNLAMRRGAGYQLIDYEMSKFVAILFYCYTGSRDAQDLCGFGQGAGGNTGGKDSLGNANSVRGNSNNGNKVLGFENFMGCTYEWMDNVAMNVSSYRDFLLAHCEQGSYPTDNSYHIYDPLTQTERVVKSIQMNAEIARVRHGRYCDIIASKAYSDSNYATYYSDLAYHVGSSGRVVGRAYNNSSACGGLAFAFAYSASSVSSGIIGSRLAFRGVISLSDPTSE